MKTVRSLYFSSAPRGIRTPDLLVRSQTLYPTELEALIEDRSVRGLLQMLKLNVCCGEGGI